MGEVGLIEIYVNPDMKKTAGIKLGKKIFNEYLKNKIINDMAKYGFSNIQFKKLGETYRYENFTTGFIIDANKNDVLNSNKDYINYWFNVSNKGNNNIELHRVTNGVFSYIPETDLNISI